MAQFKTVRHSTAIVGLKNRQPLEALTHQLFSFNDPDLAVAKRGKGREDTVGEFRGGISLEFPGPGKSQQLNFFQ